MDYDSILLRYGEIFLKGKNRYIFEKKLISNIKTITSVKKIKNIRSRLIVDYFSDHHLLKNIFGLTSYSLAVKVEPEIDIIKQVALDLVKEKEGSFKVSTKRSDKRFPIKSPDVNVVVGSHIEENSQLNFKLKEPDHILFIEINQDGTYLYLDVVNCFGGLPSGVEGRVYVLLENEASFLAGLLIMKRGCEIVPVSSKDFNLSLLQRYNPQKLENVKIKIFYETDKIIDNQKMNVVVSGQNFANYKNYNLNKVILRPLIAYSDQEIKNELVKYKN